MGIIIKLNAMKNQLTSIEKKIAEYILEDPERIKNLNTYEIAKNCDTSQASIVRFSKKLGFSGFPDFKLSLSQDIGNRKAESHVNIMHEELKSTDSFEIIGKKVATENIRAVNNTYEITDFNELEKAVQAINNARKIMLVGVGFSGIVARDFYFKLMELGKVASFENDSHMQLSYLSTMNENDILFVISHSGKTLELFNLAKVAKNKGIKIITLTSVASNPIRELGDIKLSTVEMKSDFRATALSPRISQLTVIDMIYIKLMLENENLQDYIFNAIELVKDSKL
ncbi:MurR/RpiR family transcriptional regulator [uncultured Fusobacterium sp.]|uniref:MurR/RpiR family transcriptional regulator n=1 Tax=uncultured Fusobacterium sp. TaxID=159267 RepID=UPI0025D16332|nr:MurR/RpiR family transcriptional regulator [uncultured Fusobacterium sp.]